MPTDVNIRPAESSDLGLAKAWLSAAGLPIDDLTATHMAAFLVALQGDQAVGMIGIERFGDLGLLRSLVIDPGCRSKGLGAQLVAALERKARKLELRELWLLTIDADGFFERLGYRACERVDAPAAIRNTREFSSLCPGDAVLMCKRLNQA